MEKWTRERIESELSAYRELVCSADEYEADLAAWETQVALMKDECIEGAMFKIPPEPDMPRGGKTPDKTADIAMSLPDEQRMKKARIELVGLKRRIRRIDAWRRVLPHRHRKIIEWVYIDGMTWGEVVVAYNDRPFDGIAREERTLMRWKSQAINIIEKVENFRNGGDLSAI